MTGVLSGVAGRMPAWRLAQLELVDAGDDGAGVAEEFVHRPGTHGRVVGPRSSIVAPTTTTRRGAARGRPNARARGPHRAVEQRGSRRDRRRRTGGPSRRMWPLTGRTAGSPAASRPRDGRQSRPGRQEDPIGAEAAAVGQDHARARRPRRAPRLATNATPAGGAGGHAARQQGPVVHLVVARDLDPAAQGRGQRRHEAAALAGAAPVRRAAQRVLVGEQVVEAGAVRRIERHRERAGLCRSRSTAPAPPRARRANAWPAARSPRAAGRSGRTRRTAPR